jgi:PD-(D/E)XK nuclease superfamily
MRKKVEKEFFEKSMFLCEYKAIQEFAKNFSSHFKKNYGTQWSIVCERKEDLITVRNQILHEIEKYIPNNENHPQALFGISMYTLDNLARNFCATLAATNDKKLIQEIPGFISKPYLDVISQELLVENILNFYGYIGNDSLPIAKQILSLIDITWPDSTNFVQLIISTQNKKNIKTVQEINEKALKQILASYQYAKYELENYSRLQSLVKEYLQGKYIDHLYQETKHHNLILPHKFLKGNILWISAPEFLNSHPQETTFNLEKLSGNTIKPGNFQSFFVDEFKKSILNTRKILDIHQNLFISSRTVIPESHTETKLEKNHIHYFISENKHCYSEKIETALKDKDSLCLLADFDPGKFREIRPDAAGSYPITTQFLKEWEKCNIEFTDAQEIFPQIDSHFEKFLEQISLVSNETRLHEIGKQYSIEMKSNNDDFILQLFQKYIEKERAYIGYQHPVLTCPKALSFFASSHMPKKIISIGRAHAPTASSFHVKVLNNAISILRKQGVSIDLPASEMMYRGFWKNIANLGIPLDFWLDSSSELNDFPNYLIPEGNIHKFGVAFPKATHSHLIERFLCRTDGKSILFPQWRNYLPDSNQRISITSFERYITCPLQFFLSDIIGIKKEEQENVSVDNMEIGSRMHLIAEQLITSLVTIIGNKDYGKIMHPIFSNILESLKIETNFLSLNKNLWLHIIQNTVEKSAILFKIEIKNAFLEAIENIWQVKQENLKPHFTITQEREILKRTFFRFLQIEKSLAEDLQDQLTGIERERPVSLELGGLVFSGKIDRIDATQNGLRIIDYKTSNIPKSEKKISLFPSELDEAKTTSKLSAQGALYCLAWAQKKLLDEENNDRNSIMSFSLYHLKNLDENANPILSYEFSQAMVKDDFIFKKLTTEYTEYALRLKHGDFYPKPIKSKTCDFCDFKPLCPFTFNHDKNENDFLNEDQ